MGIALASKPIAITGASSGIGAATAIMCARAGMPVVLGARRVDKLDVVVERIEQMGGRAAAVAMDVTREDDCRRLVDETVRRFGSIYAVYANAGYGEERSMADTSDAELRAMFETNFFGTMNTIRPALARMLGNPGPDRGHILICSSCLAKLAVPYVGVYCATKAAQNHVGRAMRLELEPRGVHVSTVHPIGTRTEFFDTMAKRSGQEKANEHTPDWFMQSADFVAARTVACLRRPRPEVWTGVRGWLVRTGMAIANTMPGVTDAAMRGMVRRRFLAQRPGPDGSGSA
ncbi:MAG: SDR family NAD(P)-dependent oxidoreductase [Phycisphaerales bacterium]|nr:SDR family NAD(P)-dependent oxidoreductase [Phycisphaerales bacterium]